MHIVSQFDIWHPDNFSQGAYAKGPHRQAACNRLAQVLYRGYLPAS